MTLRLRAQPWLASPTIDGVFLLGPALVSTLIAYHFRNQTGDDVSGWAWLLLIVGVDVAHVYGTLYRTYLDPAERRRRGSLLVMAPLFGWLVGVMLYAMGALPFWRAAAYLAVFHFVRQQYGFFRLYSRRDRRPSRLERCCDAAAIYAATLYPLLFWHTHLPRRFFWFVSGDFLSLPWPSLDHMGFAVYLFVLTAYAAKELARFLHDGHFNVPRNVLLAGTALSWYVGIVVCNGDFAFTVTNVVSHGVPYMALVWIYGRKGDALPARGAAIGIPIYLSSLLVLAYFEEALWDAFLWRDHPRLFHWVQHLPLIQDPATLGWLVPLLALPQITHYVLDGFIWRLEGESLEGERDVAFGHPSFDRAL